MVNMLAAKTSPSVRDAAARCSRGLPGDPKKHIERLRRRYRTLERSGKLPKEETPDSRLQVRVNQLRSMYEQSEARANAAKPELALEEEKAKALGLDIEGPKLSSVLAGLDQARDRLESIAIYPTEIAYSHYKGQGLTEDQAVELFTRATENLRLVAEKIDLLRKIRDLRAVAGIFY